jgi:hypothetical protein
MVTATSGDLRYCVAQANATHDAPHPATPDSIVFSSELTAKPHTITLNSAYGPLVLVDSHPLTINGPTALTVNISGGYQTEVFQINPRTVVTMNNLAIINGIATLPPSGGGGGILNQGTLNLSNCLLAHDSANVGGNGGGIYNNGGTVTLTNCTLSNDKADNGGGLYNDNGGMATLNNCTLRDDAATAPNGNGGGLFATNGNGGGIFNKGSTVTLANCTLSYDTAADGGGLYNGNGGMATLNNCALSNDAATGTNGKGGGIVPVTLGGGIFNEGTVTLTNCTLANNFAEFGGGVFNGNLATLTNCTLSNNSAGTVGGGIYNLDEATLILTNTIVAGNSSDIFAVGPDVVADHDLIGNGKDSLISNGGGNIVGTSTNPIDPLLGPLQNNGGPTETMALLPGSPAIGMAGNSMAPAKDQRGITRIDELGETADIGAFEFCSATPSEHFVQVLYLDVLGRAGSLPEVDSWATLVSQGWSRAAVAASIEGSREARDHLVKTWYATYLGRQAQGGEELGWVNLLQTSTEEQVLSDILGTQEFFNRAQTLVSSGTSTQRYAQALYQVLLGRLGSSADLAAWDAGVAVSGRQRVALAFLQSQEFRTDHFEGYYNALLRRHGDTVGLDAWVHSSSDMRATRIAFEASPEFYANG